MGNNIAILTDTAKTATLSTISDYGAGVFAHTTQDYAQHTQMRIYSEPYATSSSVSTPVYLTVNIYTDTTDGGDHLNFGPFYGSFTSSDIQFKTDNNKRWKPFGLKKFGADITGLISVASGGTYTFTLNSNDGSYLFIDGTLIVNNGGNIDGFRSRSNSVALSAGEHTLEVQFWQAGGTDSGVDLTLPAGVIYSSHSTTSENVIATQTLYLGLTSNGTTLGLALPVNATGTDTFQNSAPIFVEQPQNTFNAGIGDLAQFTVTVLSDLPVTYQWQRNAPVGSTTVGTLKSQAETLQTDISALPVTSFNSPQTTNRNRALQITQRLVSELPDSLTVAPPYIAVTDAQSLIPLVSDSTVLQEISALATAIQDQIDTATGAGTPYNDIPNQTRPTLVLTNVQSTDSALYRVIATNANGTAISENGTLVVSAFKPAKKHSH